MKGRKNNWIGHTLHRNSLLERDVKGNIQESLDVMERRGKRYNQIMYSLEE